MSLSPTEFLNRGIDQAPHVLVVILNWNSHEETLAAVDSVLRMDYPNCSIAIIDNGSTDNSVVALEKIISERVELIKSPENTGFTGGCNLGLKLALQRNSDYVWLLNNDSVVAIDTLSSLVRTAEKDESIGLVSPLVASLQNPSKLLNAGGIFRPEIPTFNSTKKLEEAREWAATNPSQIMLMGTALLVKIGLVRKIGMLDPAMFAYWEDTDFSLRSIKAGFRNAVDFDAVIYHKEKSAAGADAHTMKPHYWYYMARNEIRFWKKHARLKERPKIFWWAYRGQLGNLKLLQGTEVSREAILAGMWDGWLNRAGAYHPGRRMPRIVAHAIECHRDK